MHSKQQGILRALLVSAAICAPVVPACAQQTYQFDLPAQNLGASLRQVFGRHSFRDKPDSVPPDAG